MLFNIIIATLAVSLLSLVGLVFFSKKLYTHKIMDAAIALAAGVLLANVFINLIPEIFELSVNSGYGDIKTISLWMLGFIIFLFLSEQYLYWHHCHTHHHDDKDEHVDPAGINILIGDGIHNLTDGMAIATSFMISPSFGWMATLAIALHEIPQEIGDFSLLRHSGFSRLKALFWNLISGLTAVCGGILTYFYSQVAEHQLILIALATGSFLYIALSDIMPHLQSQKRANQFTQIIWFIIGIIIIFSLSKFIDIQV